MLPLEVGDWNSTQSGHVVPRIPNLDMFFLGLFSALAYLWSTLRHLKIKIQVDSEIPQPLVTVCLTMRIIIMSQTPPIDEKQALNKPASISSSLFL